jgi:hypothetical protein
MKRAGFFRRLFLSGWLELGAMGAGWLAFAASAAVCVTMLFYVLLIGLLGLSRASALTVAAPIGIPVAAVMIYAGMGFFVSLCTEPQFRTRTVKKAVSDEGEDGDGKERV